MEITKDLFMKLANKFFADPSKGRVFREYCENVGIRMDMTVEEMAGLCKQVYDCMFLWNHTTEQFMDMAAEILKIVG